MAPREFQIGEAIGRFTLKRRLGVGSFGEVWRAAASTDLGFSKEVALKLLRTDKDVGDPEADLLREARIVAQFRHPNIVDVFSAEYVDGMVLVAMEYMDGGTVEGLIDWATDRKRQLPRSAILHIGRDIALGLAYAWSATDDSGDPFHLIHRDLKPANVLLERAGVAKVADFGLAKSSTEATATKSGMVKGTPAYLAPEMWQGSREFGPSVDLFALGAILWELTMRRRLMGGDSMYAMFGQSIGGNPDEEAAQLQGVFPGLAPLVRELIERDPAKRLADATEVAEELTDLLARERGGGDLADLLLALDVVDGKVPEASASRLFRIPQDDWKVLLRPPAKASVFAETLAAAVDSKEEEVEGAPTSKVDLKNLKQPGSSSRITMAQAAETDTAMPPVNRSSKGLPVSPNLPQPIPRGTESKGAASAPGPSSSSGVRNPPGPTSSTKLPAVPAPATASGVRKAPGPTTSTKMPSAPPPRIDDAESMRFGPITDQVAPVEGELPPTAVATPAAAGATVADTTAKRSGTIKAQQTTGGRSTKKGPGSQTRAKKGNSPLLYALLVLGIGLLGVLGWLVASTPGDQDAPPKPVPADRSPNSAIAPSSGAGGSATANPAGAPSPRAADSPIDEGGQPRVTAVEGVDGSTPAGPAPTPRSAPTPAPVSAEATVPRCLIVRSSSSGVHVWVNKQHQDGTVGANGRVLLLPAGSYHVGMGGAGGPAVEGTGTVPDRGAGIVECSLIAGQCTTEQGPASLCSR